MADTSLARISVVESDVNDISSRLREVEQRAAREGHFSNDNASDARTFGELVANDNKVRGLTSTMRGATTVLVDRAALTMANTTVGTGRSAATSLVEADRRAGIVTPPERRFTIRDLIPTAQTPSNSIEWAKETGYSLNAAMVAEGTQKPFSELTFDLVTSPVRTLAHLFKASRQILDDADALAGYINGRARYGLKFVEEVQLLSGNGTGQNLNGIMNVATAYETSRTKTGDTELDLLLKAISQAEEANLPASGIVLSVRDWRRLMGIKDLGLNYLGGGPFGSTPPVVWDLPCIPSLAMPVGSFLLGGFEGGAQIFDRLEVEVTLSSENVDNFEKNMFTLRCEERLALAVYRPEAFVKGTFTV